MPSRGGLTPTRTSQNMIRKKGIGRLLSAGVTALILAACSVAEPPVAPTQLSPFDGLAASEFDGAVFACKAGGPAGTYSFHVEKSGGGNSWFPYGQDATLTFDGTNMVCAHMWSPLDVATWGTGVTGTVTVTETALPAGVVVDYIQVWDSRNQVFLTPTVTGSNSVTINVNATNNLYYAKFYNKLTPPPPPTPSANCVAISAVQGVAIVPVTLTGSGGAGGPYTFSATGLPAGLTMSSGGTISGTPTVSGTFSYSVTVTDKDGNSGTVHCSVTVTPPPPPPVSVNCVAINAVQGLAITPVTLTGSGGAGGPYTFSATGLPAGVTLSSSGTFSGTPTVSGSFVISITVTDKDGNTGTVHCTVTVQPPPPPPPMEGCTPGFWKQSQHFDSWASGILTTQKIAMYFPSASAYSLNGKTLDQYSLLEGLRFQGGSTASGKAETLIRAAIAALLNAGGGNFAYTTAQVLSLVNAALASGDPAAMNALAGRLDVANNAGCTLN